MTDLDKLLPEEVDELSNLRDAWRSARAAEDWDLADRLRAQLYLWDSWLGVDGIWYPVFEHPLNRQRRAFKRMRKYQVDVYPWSLEEALCKNTQ